MPPRSHMAASGCDAHRPAVEDPRRQGDDPIHRATGPDGDEIEVSGGTAEEPRRRERTHRMTLSAPGPRRINANAEPEATAAELPWCSRTGGHGGAEHGTVPPGGAHGADRHPFNAGVATIDFMSELEAALDDVRTGGR